MHLLGTVPSCLVEGHGGMALDLACITSRCKREPAGTFPDTGVTAMLGSMIEMDGCGDGRGVIRGS
jgi:hypothetical protein